MTQNNFTFHNTEIIFNIAKKYDFMRYFENTEIDCFCISLFDTSMQKILSFVNELNSVTQHNTQRELFVIHYERHFDTVEDFNAYEYICVTTSAILENFETSILEN